MEKEKTKKKKETSDKGIKLKKNKNITRLVNMLRDPKINKSQVLRDAGVFKGISDAALRSIASKIKRGHVSEDNQEASFSKTNDFVYLTPSEVNAIIRTIKNIGK